MRILFHILVEYITHACYISRSFLQHAFVLLKWPQQNICVIFFVKKYQVNIFSYTVDPRFTILIRSGGPIVK